MQKQQKSILENAKQNLDIARTKIDRVRYGLQPISEKEYSSLTEIYNLICEATDKLYHI